MDRVRQALGDSDDLLKIGYAGSVGVVVGALGPWYTLPGGDILGTDGGGPGLYVLVLGVMSAAVLWSWGEVPAREKLIGVAICGGATLVLMGTDALDAPAGIGVGWGLVIGIAASITLLAVAARLYALNLA